MQTIKIQRKNVKNIYLKVTPDLEVVLTAPYEVKEEFLYKFLDQKKDWIDKKLAFFSKTEIKKEYVSGENFEYLGKNFILKVIESKQEFMKIDGNYCYLYVKEKNNFQRKRKMIEKWYRAEAKKVFYEIINKYIPVVEKKPLKVTIRKMKTKWGSCNFSNSHIILNSELIKKPKECIEYVIFHELAHLIFPNHSKEFYNYLAVYMPDWKRRKLKLND
ncbi:M48 family metallopeptidase [Nautilia sp.]